MKPTQKHHLWSDVAVFKNAGDANMLETFLVDHKFEARTYDDKLFRYFLFLRPPVVTYRVQVNGSAFRAAMELLNKNVPAVCERAVHCPSCGSLQVNYPQMTRKFVLPTVMLHLGIIFHLIEHQCYCEHCHMMWNLSAKGGIPRKEGTLKPFPF